MQISCTVCSQTQHVITDNTKIMSRRVHRHKHQDAWTRGAKEAPHLLSSAPNIATYTFIASEMSLWLE